MEQPALQHHAASGAPDLSEPDAALEPTFYSSLYIALGLSEQDPGYAGVTEAIESLGHSAPIHEGLWQIYTSSSIKDIFRQLNKSMLDRRIDGGTGLLVLDPRTAVARWYLRRPIAEVMAAMWNQRNNLFISFTLHDAAINYDPILQDLGALGTALPISKTIWFVSSAYSSKEAFQILIGRMERGDKLLVFDTVGNRASWHDDQARMSLDFRSQSEYRPHHATIHSLNPAFAAPQARSA